MSAQSGRDGLLDAELQSNLDGKGHKILNTDLSDATNTFPPATLPLIPHTTAALAGDGAGQVVDTKVTLTAPATGSTLTVADGKTFTVSNTLTLAGTDTSTLNVGTGGTLGTAAYTPTGNYATAAQGTKADAAGAITGLVKSNGSATFAAAVAKTDYWDGSVFLAGGSHAKGLVPDPGAGGGTTKYLREDGIFQVPPASSGVTIAVTTNVIKGDGAGGGVAATPGTDYLVPSTALTRLTAATVVLSGATPAINWASSTGFSWTLSANSTPTFSNSTDNWDITIAVTNGASWTLTWPTVQWQGAAGQPTQSVSGKTDFWGFKKVGSIIYGAVKQNMG
jgi:hypothetical protein